MIVKYFGKIFAYLPETWETCIENYCNLFVYTSVKTKTWNKRRELEVKSGVFILQHQ